MPGQCSTMNYIHSPFLLNLLRHDLINSLALNLVIFLPQPPKYLGLQTCATRLPFSCVCGGGGRELLFWDFETRSHAS